MIQSKLILTIALTLLKARLRQSVIAAAGVTFGIGSFIALVSFMTGLNKLLDNLIVNSTPHIRLYNEIRPSENQPLNLSSKYASGQNFIHSVKPKDEGKEIYNSAGILRTIKKDPRVWDVAPKVITPVFFNAGTIQITGVVNGIDPPSEQKLFSLNDYVVEGNILDLQSSSNSIFLCKGVADKLMKTTGESIQVTTAAGDSKVLKIGGIIQFGLADIDNTLSYTSLQTAQQLEGKPRTYITDIQIKLKDMARAPAVAKEYSAIFDVDATDIQTANVQFETGSSIRSIISYAVGITLLIVAGFGIYNILNMLIYEKMDAIAILKATGFSGYDVRLIFLSLSLTIGLSGGLLGLALGYLLSVIINHIPFETQALPTIKTFPVNFNGIYYLIGICFAIITTYVAGLFPARKASLTDPVTIIRGK